MKHLLTIIHACYTTVLVTAIALSAYGCADTVSVSPDVTVPLSSLTVTPGILQPAFSSNTTNYAVDAPTSAPSVTVTAVPKSTTDTMTINGVTTGAGQGRSIPLGAPGSTTTITIIVFSQTGNETTYTVIVTRLLSSDNNLSALSVKLGNTSQPLVPGFDANTQDYKVNVANTVGQVTVSATKSDKDATMVISAGANTVSIGPGLNPGQLLVTLGGPGTATLVTVEMTAPNGNKKTYQITINRLSGDNTLSDLKVRDTNTSTLFLLSPAFLPTTEIYSVDVPTNVTSVTVTATKSDSNAAMTGDVTAGAGIPTGATTRALGPAGPEVTIELFITVAAPDPTVTPREYHITVKRAALSSNANLSGLTVVPGTLDQIFSPDTFSYAVINVPTGDTIVFVTATKSDQNATMSVLGSVVAPPGDPDGVVPVPLGSTMEITVIAQDGVNRRIYAISFNPAPPPPPFP